MINEKEIDKIFQIFKQVNPKISSNVQLYNVTYKYRPGQLVKLEKEREIIAIWLDFESVNDWNLRILFKRHKEIPHQFFIKQVDNFYRIGWKAI